MAATKMKPKLKASDVASRLTPLAASELLDVTVDKLSFTSAKKGLSTEIDKVLVDASLQEPMQGAMAINLDLLDNDFQALNSGVFGTRVTSVVDKVSFRLTEVSIVEHFKLRAVLEHALIAEMREHSKPKKASRHSMTRAEFILSMLRELRTPFTFICPELHRKQPTAKKKESKKARQEEEGVVPLTSASREPKATPPPNVELKVKGATATAAQLEQASILLGVVSELGGNELCMVSIICAAIGESDLTAETKQNALGFWGVLQGSSGSNPKWPAYWPDPTDSAGMAHAWCKGEKGFIGGGLIWSALRLEPGNIATKTEGSGESPSFYGKYTDEAKAIVKAFTHSELGSFAAAGATSSSTYSVRTTQYEYERGQPGQTEDTFTCAQRLANEVGWSFFVCGERSIYLVTDDDLLKAEPRYKVGPKSPGLVDFRGDVSVGHRTVLIHGKRQPKPSLAELEVRIDRWGAPPGTVILVSGYGPFDGKWLVDRIERPFYDSLAVIHLRAPAKPLEEPPWEVTTVTLSGTGGESGKGVPSGIPAPAGGQYRNPPPQGPSGIVTPKASWNPAGKPVARWIVPMLEYAAAHGWTGAITSGYRGGPDPNTSTGASEHQGMQYPHGAVDFGGYEAFAERAAFFAHVDGYQGLPLIPAQFPGDGGHASGTGH